MEFFPKYGSEGPAQMIRRIFPIYPKGKRVLENNLAWTVRAVSMHNPRTQASTSDFTSRMLVWPVSAMAT